MDIDRENVSNQQNNYTQNSFICEKSQPQTSGNNNNFFKPSQDKKFINPKDAKPGFVTATRQLEIDIKTNKTPSNVLNGPNLLKRIFDNKTDNSSSLQPMTKKPLVKSSNNNQASNSSSNPAVAAIKSEAEALLEHPLLLGFDVKIVESIVGEILQQHAPCSWNDIGGLEGAKKMIEESVIWPLRRPDLYVGVRKAPKGLLLFGPPGTGKTMIAKVLANEAKACFFSISASSLTSKWHGEGEKMVRALFAVARIKQPSVIFMDEIDSLLTARSDSEFEASRRIKTEFLVQFDGVSSDSSDRILVIGATNRPQDLDEAARRRMVKRLYIALPEASGRKAIILNLLKHNAHSLTEEELNIIVEKSDGYSGSDLKALSEDAGLGPMREYSSIENIDINNVRPISFGDFEVALSGIRASVSKNDLHLLEDWNKTFGSFR